ncbi:MAG: hypothetical protein QXK18_05515 [Candidatus Bathyarchaeia archaeon]
MMDVEFLVLLEYDEESNALYIRLKGGGKQAHIRQPNSRLEWERGNNRRRKF